MRILLFPLIFLLGFSAFNTCSAQQQLRLGDIQIRYEWEGDSLYIQLQAPTQGWIAIGFNQQNDILGSDLLQFAVSDGQIHWEDQYVSAPQMHPPDERQNLRLIRFSETADQTLVAFKIPANSGDPLDFVHHPHRPFWLIAAYSVSDDFQHHSIQRKHTRWIWLPTH